MSKKLKPKKLIIALAAISSAAYFFADLNVKQLPTKAAAPKHKAIKEKVTTSSVQENYVQEREPSSIPPQPKTPKIHDFSKGRVTKAKIEGTPHPGLPENLLIAEDIYAVKAHSYSSTMGDAIEERNGYVFYASHDRSPASAVVAIDPNTQKLYTVTSVVKLANVDETLRSDLLSKGMDEQYYNENLKIMYVQNAENDSLKLHSELAQMNLEPKLDVVRSYHKIK